MTAINRQPTGWLGFLGIKNFGRNPRDTSDILSPTWDLSQLYYNAGALHSEVAYPFVLAAGPNILFAPGNQSAWHVDAFSAYLECNGAATLTACLSRVAQDGALSVFLTPSVSITAAAPAGVALARNILLQPGEALALSVLSVTGAPGAVCAAQVRYTELQA